MKIMVVGCGGTGSYLIPLLLKMMKEDDTVTLMDGDVLSEKNLDRQLFTPDQVGRAKVKALADMYDDDRITAEVKYLEDAGQLDEYDLVFACPDNHVARACVMDAVDDSDGNMLAIICGNEYSSASSYIYAHQYKDTPMDPRVRHPEILTDRTGSPVVKSCTGEAQVENKQLALANNTSAVYAMQLAYFWKEVVEKEFLEDKDLHARLPAEFCWVPSKISTLTVGDLMEIK